MQHLMKLSVLALGLAGLSLGSCSDDGAASVPGALGRDNRPDPGDQIDRAGRPAITAALVSTFSPDTRDDDRDDYNTSSRLGDANFKATVEASLAILDGLDGNCGNQLLAGTGAVGESRYSTLAGILLDDQIYVHTDDPRSTYLGLELEAAEVVSPPTGVGGGRAPGEDVIARSYSLLAAGLFSGTDDGVANDDAVHDPDNFPFLAAPQ